MKPGIKRSILYSLIGTKSHIRQSRPCSTGWPVRHGHKRKRGTFRETKLIILPKEEQDKAQDPMGTAAG